MCAVAVGCFAVSPVSAADDKDAGSGPNPYSQCGIGAAIFPNTPVGAVISNVIWDLGTTAVISATASPETCNGKKAEAAAFILKTYDNLAEETARGEGDHLTALLNILEVDAANRDAVLAEVRYEMADAISTAGYDQQTAVDKASHYYTVVVNAATGPAA